MAMRFLVGCSQGGMAPGPQPQNGPTNATDCGSDSFLTAWGGQSRASCNQASCIGMQKGCHKRNLNFNISLKRKKNIDDCCIQKTNLHSTHRFSIRGYEIHHVDREDRPKHGVLTLVIASIPSTAVQRSEKVDMEYIAHSPRKKPDHL